MAISLWELQSDLSLKDAASTIEGIILSSINYLHKGKSENLCDELCSEMNENTFVDSFLFRFDLFVSLFLSSHSIIFLS